MQSIADAVAKALDPTERHVDRPLPWAEWRAAIDHADAVLLAVDAGQAPAIGSELIGNAARAIVTGTPVALPDFLVVLVDVGRLTPDAAAQITQQFT